MPHGREYTFSRISFEPNPEPDAFESKLTKLLDFLESDREGIMKLIKEGDSAVIHVYSTMYYGNIRGFHFYKDVSKRIGDFNVEIDFDLYVSCTPFKSA